MNKGIVYFDWIEGTNQIKNYPIFAINIIKSFGLMNKIIYITLNLSNKTKLYY